MIKRLATVFGLAILSGIFYFIDASYPTPQVHNLFLTAITLTALFIVFKVVIEEMVSGRIGHAKTRYMFRKANSVLFLAACTVTIARIWIKNPEALVVAYGLMGAGVAFSLQDIFKNFAGGILLFVTGIYRIGDRIEAGKVTGDVIDIGIMYTQVLEIQEWVNGDQATGRIVNVPNGLVLGSNVINATRDNTFLWDELTIPITYDSDWEEARELITSIIADVTEEMAEQADQELSDIQKSYVLSERDTDGRVFMELTDNWINLHARYVTDAKKRRATNNEISNRILDAVEANEDITIASETIEIVGMPDQDRP